MFAGNFAPVGWMFCEGQLLPISEWDALFNLIGTTYGGDGQETFALPDLRGRLPMHFGNGFNQAEAAGVETVTLTLSQIPNHSHALVASNNIGTQASPENHMLAQSSVGQMYYADVADTALSPNSVAPTGGSQPHDNFQPYLCVNFIMSMFGLYPSPT